MFAGCKGKVHVNKEDHDHGGPVASDGDRRKVGGGASLATTGGRHQRSRRAAHHPPGHS